MNSSLYIILLVVHFVQPIIGGGIAQAAGWRSVFYFTSAYGGALLIILIFALPETLPTHSRLYVVCRISSVLCITFQLLFCLHIRSCFMNCAC